MRAAAAAAAVILRQSLHSVATVEPKEKLLNSWPHFGQFGILKFSLSATGDLPRANGNPTIRARQFHFRAVKVMFWKSIV